MNKYGRIVMSMLVMAALVLIVGLRPTAADVQARPWIVNFDKVAVADGMWQGTISGDLEGTLTTVLTSLEIRGPIWHVEFDWIIDAGDVAFTAPLSGILNTNTGRVVMNGVVGEGHLSGARVHEEGLLVDVDTQQFLGTIWIMLASAD
jgi:hypothetical protein